MEEAVGALESELPLYVLGGWGGVTKLIADALSGRWPNEFELEWQLQHNAPLVELKTACEIAGAQRELDQEFARARKALDGVLDDARWPDNGLSVEENRTLFETESITEARRLLRKGLEFVRGN